MSRKILVADDNLAVQRLISATLREEGIEVLSVSTGPAALAALESVQDDPPCLILADFNLEGMHLFTFVRKVHQDDRFAEIPVIALIHAIDSYDSAHLASVGIRDVLKKPLHAEELLKTVEVYLPPQVAPAVLSQEIVQETAPSPIVPAMEAAEDRPTATEMDARTVVQTDAAGRLTEEVGVTVADPPGFNPEPWPEPWPELGPALPDLPHDTDTLAMPEETPDPVSPAAPADEAAPVPDFTPDAPEVVRTHVVTEVEEAVTRAVRQLLPEFLEAALTQEVIQTALQTALEKVAREVVLPLAEAEIIKEIKRLQPEESL